MSRKVVLDLAVTLDGFIEGKNGEIDWCIMEDEMNFTEFLSRIDTILFGRKSYEGWGNYQLGPEASQSDREIWGMMHNMKKYVFSTTLQTDDDVVVVRDHVEEVVRKLKSSPGKDIWLFGGASLITTFMKLGLIDEYRLSVHPVILGAGKPLFVDIQQREELQLIDVNRYSSGVVQLCYQSMRK